MKLNLRNLLAIGTDNVSVMVGVNNGVCAKLKVELPHLILIKCLCYSLQLAVSQASRETLPKELEFLIAETNRWFSHSFLRQQLYKQLYQTINDGANPLKIPKSCATRWFSIHHAVERVVQQWLELKTHFSIVRNSEDDYTSEVLYKMYADEKHLAYFLFLLPILSDVQRVNKMFKFKTIDHLKLLDQLVTLFKTIGKTLVLPTSRCNF